jgi:hypothetical protein
MSQANPATGVSPDVETAWRRYVGDRARGQQVDQFIELSHSGDDNKRVLAFAVLAQLNRAARGGRGNPAMVQKITTAIDAGWADPSAAKSLVRAIAIMKLESAYTDKLAEFQSKK